MFLKGLIFILGNQVPFWSTRFKPWAAKAVPFLSTHFKAWALKKLGFIHDHIKSFRNHIYYALKRFDFHFGKSNIHLWESI